MLFTSLAEIDAFFLQLEVIFENVKNNNQLYSAVVDAPFSNKRLTTAFGLGFITFLLYNKDTGNIDRIKKTNNELAYLGGEISMKPFEAIKVPLKFRGNIIAEAIRSGRYQQTSDWTYILSPDLNAEESRFNQANSGISCSFVYPFKAHNGGALIFHYFIPVDQIKSEHRNFMHRYTKLVNKALSK